MREKCLSLKANMLYNSVGSLFYLACQWLVSVGVVRLAGYEAGGLLTLGISITNMLFAFSTFGIRTYQVSDLENRFSATDYVTTRLATACAALVLCGIYGLAAPAYTQAQRLCIISYMVFKLSEAQVDVFQGIQQRAGRMDFIFISFLLRGVLSLGGFCLTLYLTQNVIWAVTVMAALTLGVVWIYDMPVSHQLAAFTLGFRQERIGALLRISWPLMLTSMLTSALVSLPRTVLERVCGSEALGIYGAVAIPAVIVQTLCMLIYTPLIAPITAQYTQKDRRAFLVLTGKAIGAVLCIAAGLTAGAAWLGEWGLNLLFGAEIRPYAYLLVPVLGASTLVALNWFMNTLLTIARYLKTIMLANLAGVLAVLGFSAPLIRRYAMEGVNAVMYIGLGVSLLIMGGGLWDACRKQFGGRMEEEL